MSELRFQDSETLDLSVSPDGAFTGEIIPLGTACALVDSPDALAKLRDAIDTNTVPTGLTFGVADGVLTGTLTMSAGDPLTGTVTLPPDVFAADGAVIDGGAGTFTLPRNDGSTVTGTFTPPADVDFASTSVTGNVISYLDDNGGVIATTTLPVDASLLQPTLGADGCTATFPLSNGQSWALDLCDFLSNMTQVTNADGSITVTHEAGGVTQSFTIPEPLTQSDGTAVPRDCVQPEILSECGDIARKNQRFYRQGSRPKICAHVAQGRTANLATSNILPPAPAATAIVLQEDAVLVVSNPYVCEDMVGIAVGGGRTQFETLESDMPEGSNIMFAVNQIRVNGGAWQVTDGSDFDDNSVRHAHGVRGTQPLCVRVPPGGSAVFDRAAAYGNQKPVGNDPRTVRINLPAITFYAGADA